MTTPSEQPRETTAASPPPSVVESRRRRIFSRYLLGLGLVTLLLCGGVVALNSVVDPLWLWKGNQLTGRNLIFNERLAKLNLLLQNPDSYDCLIFGSSRTTMLDPTKIEGYRCANLAFSAGNIVELLAYARYLADRGVDPELVVVGVDDFNFLPSMNHAPEIPDFVQHLEAPPGLVRSYLSLSALDFSERTLRGQSPLPRYYDRDFVGHIFEDAPDYEPPEKLGKGYDERFDPGRANLYRQLRDTFPEARFWGYVPPVSIWEVAENRYLTGQLDLYLQAVTRTARLFDVFYDFSVPSAVTRRRDNTYDGSHYDSRVNAMIAARLQTPPSVSMNDGFGLPIGSVGQEDYRTLYTAALERFLATEFPKLARTTEAAAR